MNFGIINNNDVLSVEKRPFPNQDEVIPLKLWNLSQGNYQFEIQPVNFPASITPLLKDNFLQSITPVNQFADTKINFSITSDVGSSAANRFSITFGKPAKR